MLELNTSVSEEICESLEAGRASDVFRYLSLAHIICSSLAIVSGALLWYRHRKRVYLTRRNPALVGMLVLPLLFNMLTASFYRWYLNEDTIFGRCAFGNFNYAMVVPTLMIPMSARMMSFHHRAKLNDKLAKITKELESTFETAIVANPGTSPDLSMASEAASSKVMRSRMTAIADQTPFDNYKIYKEVNYLKMKARSKYSIQVAVGQLVLALLGASLYAMFTCPFPSLGLETCEYAFIATPAIAFVLIPGMLPIVIYIYFKQLIKRLPDPFMIRHEMNVFAILILLGFSTVLFSFFDLGSFATPEPGEMLYFKWETLLDYIMILIFINSVHRQVYLATKTQPYLAAVPYTLNQILEHPDGVSIFETFLQNDFSVENLKVYQILVNWRSLARREIWSIKRTDSEARRIFTAWLDPTNEDAVGVNVAHGTISPIVKEMKGTGSNFPSTFFDDIIDEVYSLMASDSFPRFVTTNKYREFVGVQEPELLKDEYWDELEQRRKRCCFCF